MCALGSVGGRHDLACCPAPQPPALAELLRLRHDTETSRPQIRCLWRDNDHGPDFGTRVLVLAEELRGSAFEAAAVALGRRVRLLEPALEFAFAGEELLERLPLGRVVDPRC